MKLRMSYRIASGLTLSVPGMESINDDASPFVSIVPRIILDNVYQFHRANNAGSLLNFSRDIPNWMPPFTACFCEYNTRLHQFGALVCVGKRTDANWLPDLFDDAGARITTDDTLVVKMAFWHAMSGRLSGKAMCLPNHVYVAINPRGQHLGFWFSGKLPGIVSDKDRTLLMSIAMVVGLGFSFMHCKNVTQSEVPIECSRKWHQHQGIPVLKFRTLNINPMKEALRAEGGIETNGLKKALHICRGHFANYSEEKPLFGKYAGQFWKPSHVRGSIEQGAVVKDYQVSGVSHGNAE